MASCQKGPANPLNIHMGDCQNYGPFLGPYYNTGPNTGPNLGDPKRDHNFDNPPHVLEFQVLALEFGGRGIGFGLWGVEVGV